MNTDASIPALCDDCGKLTIRYYTEIGTYGEIHIPEPVTLEWWANQLVQALERGVELVEEDVLASGKRVLEWHRQNQHG